MRAAGYCNNCGRALEDAGRTCPSCGARARLPADDGPPTEAHPSVGRLDTEVGPAGTGGGGPSLAVIRGRITGARYQIYGRHLIGRASDADIFLDDVTVSREHAVVRLTHDGVLQVEDLTSLNGTYLNGERVEEAILIDGDVLQIGVYKLQVDAR